MTGQQHVPADVTTIESVWRQRWGLPVVTLIASYTPDQVEALMAVGDDGVCTGLITWSLVEETAEIVTLDALAAGEGIGSALLTAAEEAIAAAGGRRVVLQTTNDNLRALGLYVRCGYRLVSVALDAMDNVRRLKPELPALGMEGLPLRDVLVLEKLLS